MAPPPSEADIATNPGVTLPQGRYVGIKLVDPRRFPKPIEAFHGVPYAQTTAGRNRFRSPQPLPLPSSGKKVVWAREFGDACPGLGGVKKGFSEDCLNANIYRPADVVGSDGLLKDREKKPLLPVIVYVHGGGFNAGNGLERDMASFVAWANAPMVSVNFNYRVGALGFLPSELTAREGLLNLGLRDQQMLLEWVKDNVEAFGGDPENITIMGLSAGAHSVGHHIMYYAQTSKPAPFHKAILESGATTARAVFVPTHPRHLIQFREFLVAAGLEGVPEDEIFDRLREAPVETLVEASHAIWNLYEPSVTWPFQPVIDGPNGWANSSHTGSGEPLIPNLPINSWRKGKHLHIPVMTGFNTNEGTVFIPPDADTNAQFRDFFKALIPAFSEADLDELEKLYPDPVISWRSPPYKTVIPPDKGRQWARLDAAYSHYAYICPVLQTAHFLSTVEDGPNKKPVYVYRFAATGKFGAANHADEAPIVAHDIDVLTREFRVPGLLAVSDAMHGAWARFVVSKTGDINSTDASGGGGTGGINEGAAVVQWPEFKSPFSKDEVEDGKKSKRWLWGDDGDGPSGDTGKIMVFGEGNDERRGAEGQGRLGIPARVEQMTPLMMRTCKFWWARVGLSEGLGRMEEDGKKMKGGLRAKL
ncbi:Alpha/Beta hydrolase protein [Apodospora peruviana]|uniref:Carboxylic ester hydrolase n=1 Tax=Apodospora peruviana TaxID=516989 RepID=A0AAE0HY78_9PEZI|nr:Alpha/Beta hydrolase protein [Apodospora peruviana]